MEELKLLIEMVANLPTLTVWVLVGFLTYKLAVVGSIYGVIRMAIDRFHNWSMAPKRIEFGFGKTAIDDNTALALRAQIDRLTSYGYLHSSGVDKLRKAIDSVLNHEDKSKL